MNELYKGKKYSKEFKKRMMLIGLNIVDTAGLLGVSHTSIKRFIDDAAFPAELYDKFISLSDQMIAGGGLLSSGARVKELRENLGLSIRAFAKEIGIAASGLQYIETENRKVSEKIAAKIEDHFRVGRNYLMYGIEDDKEYPLSDGLVEFIKSSPDLRKELWDKYDQAKIEEEKVG